VLLVQNFLDGEELDDPARSLVKRGAFLPSIGSIPERREEAALAARLASCRLYG
jgi:hypothetical protein